MIDLRSQLVACRKCGKPIAFVYNAETGRKAPMLVDDATGRPTTNHFLDCPGAPAVRAETDARRGRGSKKKPPRPVAAEQVEMFSGVAVGEQQHTCTRFCEHE